MCWFMMLLKEPALVYVQQGISADGLIDYDGKTESEEQRGIFILQLRSD